MVREEGNRIDVGDERKSIGLEKRVREGKRG